MLIQSAIALLTLGGLSSVRAAFPITGAPVGDRNVPVRQNIDDLESQGGAKWDLYVQALNAMQDVDPDDPLSYFQISAIHGAPFIPWDDAQARVAQEGWGGYCPHGEKLFLAWHRPYVVLFEQVLVIHAQRIAEEYPQRFRDEYKRAADDLRSPYWDWAATGTVPPATTREKVKVKVPGADNLREVEVRNPLYTYKIPQPALDEKYGPFDSHNRERTLRCTAQGESYPDTANELMSTQPFKQWVYDAFVLAESFDEFASTAEAGLSLEQIHNNIHASSACGQQLMDPSLAAFDPIFMLHHTNMDRLYRIWQALYPKEEAFKGSYSGGARFSTSDGTTITPDSPLQPFIDSEGNFHTSRSVLDVANLGYEYDGLERGQKSDEEMTRTARQIVNSLYRPNPPRSPSRIMRRGAESRRYFAAVKLEVSEIERPCSIDLYVDGERAASMWVPGEPAHGTTHAKFPIDATADSKLSKGVKAEDVVNSIKSGLQVAIVKPDGTRIPVETAKSLEVVLSSVPYTSAQSDDEFPTYGSPEKQPVAYNDYKQE